VDLTDPTRAVTATLDGPVLAVLARAGKPLTVGEVAAQAPRGSEIGVRRSLARLVDQGIVRATEMGRNRVHELNRDHVASPVAEALSALRITLWTRLRKTIAGWNPEPVYACVFGSAARGDGDTESDIDLLLVRPRLVDETGRQSRKWERQIGELHDQVQAWTGNALQIVEIPVDAWVDRGRRSTALFEQIDRDGVEIFAADSAADHLVSGSR
jgi:predicted nucleotidyltransferase